MAKPWTLSTWIVASVAIAGLAIGTGLALTRAPALPPPLLPQEGRFGSAPPPDLDVAQPPDDAYAAWGDRRWRHDDQLYCLAFAGDELLSGGNDNVVRRWDRDGRLLWTSETFFQIHVVEPLGDGTLLVAGSDATAYVVDMRSGRRLHALGGHHTIGKTAAVHQAQRLLAIDGQVRQTWLWDLATGKRLAVVDEPLGHANGRAFLADRAGRARVLLGGQPPAAVDGRTGEVLATADPLPSFIGAVGASRDGLTVAVVGAGVIRLLDPDTLRTRGELLAEPHFNSVVVHDDGTVIAGDYEGGLWRWRAGEAAATAIAVAEEGVQHLRLSPDGSRLAVAWDSHHRARWFATAGWNELAAPIGELDGIACLAASPDGRLLATGGSAINLWDAATGRWLRRFGPHGVGVAALAFTPDSTLLISGGWDQSVATWDVAAGADDGGGTGRVKVGFSIRTLGCSADRLLVAGESRAVVYDLVTMRPVWERDAVPDPDGIPSFGAAWCDGAVLVHDRSGADLLAAADGDRLRRLPADGWVDTFGCRAAALADGTVICDRDGDIRWLDGRRRVPRRLGNSGAFALSPDRALLAVGCRSALLILDAASGRTLAAVAAPTTRDVTFAPDGQRIYTVDRGAILAWDVPRLLAAGVALPLRGKP